MRDPLEEGQGNFGSLDGDKAAAMRYTEVRMSKLASEFLNDIEKKTVDFHPNYDGSEQEPEVLPTKVPNLLLNGSSGIAVGMATNIPPHNLGELCDGLLRLIDDPDCSIDDLMQSIKGPDFPTAGFVYAGQGLRDAYHTGRGVVKVRGRVEVKEHAKLHQLVIREIPYGVNKADLVSKIAALVNDKKLDGVTDHKALPDKKGIRIIVALRRGTIPEMVINGLYKYTQLESSFGINMLAVVDNKPQQLNLRTALGCFLDHRREVVIRRTRFDLEKAQFRSHILEGLLKALDIIDEIIELIRSSETPPIAKKGLVDTFGFSDVQAQSILDMRLQRLTGLEREKILDEFNELQKLIVYLTSILEDVNVLRSVLREETQYIKDTYATPRRTEIVYESLEGIEVEDLIPDDDVVITLSRRGYIKRTTLANYQQQKRGGKGIAGLHTSEDDFVQEFLTTTNHQFLLLFTNKGRMYQLKVHQVPEGSRTAKGMHIANLLPMDKEEWVANALTVREFSENSYFLFATKQGVVKRSMASDYAHCRRSGMIALGLKEGDELIAVREVSDTDFVVLATSQGMAIRFALSGVRPMGRTAAGVKGISLRGGDKVVACVVVGQDDDTTKIMTISSLGYGKRTKVDLYRIQSRGGIGLINFKSSPKTGPVIGAMPVSDTDSLVLLTSTNKIIRLGVDDIRSIGRATMGVRLVKLDDGATVAGFDKVEESGEENS
jgi:DNA gyrase subunit A